MASGFATHRMPSSGHPSHQTLSHPNANANAPCNPAVELEGSVAGLRYFCQTCPYVFNIQHTVRRVGAAGRKTARKRHRVISTHEKQRRLSPPNPPTHPCFAPQIRRRAKLRPKEVEDIFDDEKVWANAQRTNQGASRSMEGAAAAVCLAYCDGRVGLNLSPRLSLSLCLSEPTNCQATPTDRPTPTDQPTDLLPRRNSQLPRLQLQPGLFLRDADAVGGRAGDGLLPLRQDRLQQGLERELGGALWATVCHGQGGGSRFDCCRQFAFLVQADGETSRVVA